ncbi:hypothetical protein P7H15_01315 [Paenibacillus larvae]|nr:hypothetical protein [Paenibacillus larvae]MDT2291825.1 hypothetical protein [Paenibacillus larvae]
MRAENEYLKKTLGATKEGKKNVTKIAQYAVVDQLYSRVIVSQCFVKSLMYPEVGFTNGSEDVVRLLVNNWRINS